MNWPLVRIYSALTAITLTTITPALAADADAQRIQRSAGTRTPVVTIVSGTYGQNCGAPEGNLTADLVRRCNGRDTCSYPLPSSAALQSEQTCRASFVAQWRCGQDESHFATLGAGARSGDRLVMSCIRYGGAGK